MKLKSDNPFIRDINISKELKVPLLAVDCLARYYGIKVDEMNEYISSLDDDARAEWTVEDIVHTIRNQVLDDFNIILDELVKMTSFDEMRCTSEVERSGDLEAE